ncbi:MAG TPA: NosD domain-containing protein, partial [Thermoanaerobaculia bacterium]
MPRSLAAILFALLIAPPAFADSADLVVTAEAPASAPANSVVQWNVVVRNAGPDNATNVVVSGSSTGAPTVATCNPPQQTIPLIRPGEVVKVPCEQQMPNAPTLIELRPGAQMRIVPEADPDLSNNFPRVPLKTLTDPDLVVFVSAPQYFDADLPLTLELRYRNAAFVDAHDVVVTVGIPAQLAFVRAPQHCTFDEATHRVTCSVGTLAAADSDAAVLQAAQIVVRAPRAPSAEPVVFSADISGSDREHDPATNHYEWRISSMYAPFYVTNTADSGEGSLRAAMENALSRCFFSVPCKVAFRIPLADGAKWATIRPQSPLPPIGGFIVIDGATQTGLVGDTNPDGPEIEINGALQADGDGLAITGPCGANVLGLAINGFAGNGVAIRTRGGCTPQVLPAPRGVAGNCIGVDPTGTRAVPNLRGIFIDAVPTVIDVRGNFVSGNTRSGIYVQAGFAGRIERNWVVGNGASGIFIAPGGSGTDLNDNEIAFNGEFGISLARGTQHVAINGNSIHANGQLGIDYGLDGVSTETPATGVQVMLPEITSARYDAATNTTLIEG